MLPIPGPRPLDEVAVPAGTEHRIHLLPEAEEERTAPGPRDPVRLSGTAPADPDPVTSTLLGVGDSRSCSLMASDRGETKADDDPGHAIRAWTRKP